MATMEDFQAALSAVDTETTRIGDYIATLTKQLAAGGMTAEQEASVLTGLQAAAERLKGVGSSVQQPVPPGALPSVPV